jgi:hypothetical protein
MSVGESSRSRRYGSSRVVEELLERLPLPLALILAEEIREGVEEALRELRGAEATRSIVLRDRALEGVFELLSLSGRGRIRELLLVSTSPDFNLYVELDGLELVNHSFRELEEVSEVLEEVDAFERNGYYVVRLRGLGFRDKCLVVVKPHGRLVLKHAFALYDTAI